MVTLLPVCLLLPGKFKKIYLAKFKLNFLTYPYLEDKLN